MDGSLTAAARGECSVLVPPAPFCPAGANWHGNVSCRIPSTPTSQACWGLSDILVSSSMGLLLKYLARPLPTPHPQCLKKVLLFSYAEYSGHHTLLWCMLQILSPSL